MKPILIATMSLLMMTGLLSAQNMFGAFQIYTEPQGAIITINGTNQYLGTTPSQVFPILMDQYMVYNYGIPGRTYSLLITKEGYLPIQQEIFVPYNNRYQQDAIRNPTVFSFYLTRHYQQPPAYYCPPPPRPHNPWYYWNLRPHRQPQWDYPPRPPQHGGGQGGHGSHGNDNGGGNGNHGGGNGNGNNGHGGGSGGHGPRP